MERLPFVNIKTYKPPFFSFFSSIRADTDCWEPAAAARRPYWAASSAVADWTVGKCWSWVASRARRKAASPAPGSATCRKNSPCMAILPSKRRSSTLGVFTICRQHSSSLKWSSSLNYWTCRRPIATSRRWVVASSGAFPSLSPFSTSPNCSSWTSRQSVSIRCWEKGKFSPRRRTFS